MTRWWTVGVRTCCLRAPRSWVQDLDGFGRSIEDASCARFGRQSARLLQEAPRTALDKMDPALLRVNQNVAASVYTIHDRTTHSDGTTTNAHPPEVDLVPAIV